MIRKIILLSLIALMFSMYLYSQGPQGKNFGFGLVLGDPLGATIKSWTNRENAFDAYIGGSYFGSLRIGGDYLWHFDAFRTQIVKLYAGIGATIGFGTGHSVWYKDNNKEKFYYRESGEIGIGGRVIFGINVIPKRTPLEIFLELGPMIGFTPEIGVGMDVGIGIRFYP